MPYCQRCDRDFSHQGYEMHLRDSSSHWLCNEHDKDFGTWTSLQGHYVQDSDHFYCQYCDEHFEDEDDLMDHGGDQHFVCRPCGKLFRTKGKKQEHCKNNHYYCISCDRLFNSQSNLDHHLRSKIHQPSVFACPGGKCRRAFVSVSALILHAESGACPSGVTRQKVNEYVVRMDRSNVITNPNRLITSGDGRGYSAPEQTYTYATSLSWNGSAYECFLCHKEFRSLQALNSHLASPVHQARIYRCPNGACRMEFNTLSGLSQHVEGGYCGVQLFRQVRDIIAVMDRIQSGMRAITI